MKSPAPSQVEPSKTQSAQLVDPRSHSYNGTMVFSHLSTVEAPRGSQHRTAFTLLELLVAVSVMAILAALLMTVWGMVRFSAKKLECANNIRQIHLILVSQANDRHGKLMSTSRLWNDSLRFPNAAYVKGPKAEAANELSFLSLDSYLDFRQTDNYAASFEFVRLMRMWACPVYHAKGANSGEPAGSGFTVSEGNGNSYITCSYSYLAGVSTWSPTEKEGCAESITDRRPEANQLLLSDSTIRWSNQLWYLSHFRAGEGGVLPIDRVRVKRAFDGANQLFGDGHLRYKPASEFMIDAMHDDTPGPLYARNTIDRWFFLSGEVLRTSYVDRQRQCGSSTVSRFLHSRIRSLDPSRDLVRNRDQMVGGRSLLCPPGTLLLVRAGTPYRVLFAQGGHETWIFFEPPTAWRDLLIWPETVPGVALRMDEQPHDAALRDAVRDAHGWWAGSERQRLWLATNALERGLLLAALDLPGASLAGIDPALAALVDWLAHGPPEPLDVAALARRVGWSTSHFAHMFRSQLGVAPLTWLEARRIEHAKRLLLTTNLAIKAIALATGFRDSQHLVRRFHRLVDCTPGNFRRASG